ncbi:NUDIX hydrolase [Paenibacillus kobensis]|uniref:NUDIX hydrolase n=1 Tax=Paenibacillus kobensis TaxID=59841 RepID=UPI000FDC476D|nr:NUDIX domain-containing protein [Paenibacillus kobensis]
MQQYRHMGVYGVLVKDNRVLLIKKGRGPHTGKWDLPGGTIEFGEEPYDTLIREFEEETGIVELRGTIRSALSYTLIHPFKGELEELHHIGIIYDVTLLSETFDLKADGDEQDSLGAQWIALEELPDLPVTPFVEQLLVSKL